MCPVGAQVTPMCLVRVHAARATGLNDFNKVPVPMILLGFLGFSMAGVFINLI